MFGLMQPFLLAGVGAHNQHRDQGCIHPYLYGDAGARACLCCFPLYAPPRAVHAVFDESMPRPQRSITVYEALTTGAAFDNVDDALKRARAAALYLEQKPVAAQPAARRRLRLRRVLAPWLARDQRCDPRRRRSIKPSLQ